MNDISEEVVFDATFVQHFSKAVTFEGAIDYLSENFLRRDLVTKNYADAVKKRENKFPTGLPTIPIGVAIPHTDAKYVRKNAIAVGILKSPIYMTEMGTDNEQVAVSIIFLLALRESNKQLNILSKLMKIVQNKSLLEELPQLTDEEIAQEVLQNILE